MCDFLDWQEQYLSLSYKANYYLIPLPQLHTGSTTIPKSAFLYSGAADKTPVKNVWMNGMKNDMSQGHKTGRTAPLLIN